MMSSLHWFLIAWYAFEHTIYVVYTPGAAGHAPESFYEGAGPSCLQYAKEIGGFIWSLVPNVGQIWPGP